MQNNLEETIRSKRQFKRVLIVFAIVEFIVTAFVLGHVIQK